MGTHAHCLQEKYKLLVWCTKSLMISSLSAMISVSRCYVPRSTYSKYFLFPFLSLSCLYTFVFSSFLESPFPCP